MRFGYVSLTVCIDLAYGQLYFLYFSSRTQKYFRWILTIIFRIIFVFFLRQIGISAIRYKVPAITTISGARAAVRGIRNIKNGSIKYRSLQEVFE